MTESCLKGGKSRLQSDPIPLGRDLVWTVMSIPSTDAVLERHAFRTNALMVAVLAFFCVGPYLLASGSSMSTVWAFLSGAGMMAGLLWRRANPRRMLLVVTAAGIVHLLAVPWPTMPLVAIPIAVYSYARWVDGHPRLVLLIGAIASVLGPLSWAPSLMGPDGTYSIVGKLALYLMFVLLCAGLVVTPYAFGRRIRDADLIKQQREAALAQRQVEALRARDHAARMAEMNTRAQIARELHDIVAHSVSVMIVQAEGGKALATKKPEAAAEVLGTIAETGREALTEMRRLVGVLRDGPGDDADWTPTPSLEDLGAMVERAGDRVRFEMYGETPLIPPVLQLTIFRVAQEGVTNFLKHAGPDATCVVSVDQAPRVITLTVEDDGLGAAAPSDGVGHGLRGMQERVAAVAGTLVARPRHDGRGFLVRATFPLAPHTDPRRIS